MKENKNFKRLMVFVIAIEFCFLGIEFNTSVRSDENQPQWPTAWELYDIDPGEDGVHDDYRDVHYAYYHVDNSYIYFRLECYGYPDFEPESRYKFFIDVDDPHNMGQSGGSVHESEYLLFVEDSPKPGGDGQGDVYLLEDLNNDGFISDDWPDYLNNPGPILNNSVAGYRIDDNCIDVYISHASISNPTYAYFTWATDNEDPSLNQAPHTDRSNNYWDIDVLKADLSIVKYDSQDPVDPGESLTYTLNVTNHGPHDAENVNITDALPAEVVFDSSFPTPNGNSGSTYWWTYSSLGVSESEIITINVTADSGVTGNITNIAHVYNDTYDPVLYNNEYSEKTNINPMFTLNVYINGNGSVFKNPDQAFYVNGTVVELNDTADFGWTFSHWSGDLSGDTNPDSITMDSDKDVTAHFSEIMYTLTVNVDGNGVAFPSVGVHSFACGTVVPLESFADTCWEFAGWSGDINTMDNPTDITMDSNKTVTATFTEIYYNLTINVIGSGTTTPAVGVSFACDTVVPLESFADPGWSFDHWSGDLTGTDNPTTITMDGDKTVTATFNEIFYDLTIDVVGSGTTTPAEGIHTFAYGTTVPLEAFDGTCYEFDGWSGDINTMDNPTEIFMDDDKTVTAAFNEIFYDLTIDVVGGGTTYPIPGVHNFAFGSVVLIDAIPDGCWEFAGWSGDIEQGQDDVDPLEIIMDGNKAATATFTEIFYNLTIIVDVSGTTTPAHGVHSYACNTVVSLEAIADSCYEFAGWSGDLVSSNPSESIYMDEDKTITATFTEIFYNLTIIVDGCGTTTPAEGVHIIACGTVVPVEAFACPNWAFTEWTGDLVSTANPDTINMNGDKTITAVFKQGWTGWTSTLTIDAHISSPNNLDNVVFGESAIASDGIDGFDIPKPDAPPAPYLYAFLATDLADPYDILWEEFRYYPADEQVWDLFVETQGTGQYTTTTMTWNPSDITISGYDYVGLYEMISGHCVADMKNDNTYVYLSDHTTPQYFQIRCTNNHAPVANDDFYTTNENTELTVTSPGVLVNDNDPEGDFIEVTGIISGPSNGTVNIFADGHFVYTPYVGFSGTVTFEYQITDGEFFDTATVTIEVTTLNRISIKERWNLISMPVGEDIDRNDIIVEYNLVRYSWQEAINQHIVLGGFTYGWQGGMYNNDETFVPGEGYWLWSYEDCDLLIPSSVPGDNHVTYLDVEWNLVGVPYGTDVSKTSLRVQFEAIWRYWDTAVNMGVILDFVYDWDRDNQFYGISDDPNTFVSGFGYWVYAYHGCALKKI